MLKIAKSVEYSLLAIKYINENSSKGSLTAREIAENENIPYDLLAKILQKLVKNGIIKSVQGNKGGYLLDVSLNKLFITDLIAAVDQSIQLTDCMVENPTINDCARYENCCIKDPLNKMQNKINEILKSTTLMEIIE
ncbi:MAG: Rrf2 family transcriptional regulator [Ignavibacteriae bacterium]|nr:Rrf2 family transcriptional regulator [Ignavibacteriota bacterium]NOG96607.1 Rrf2 family transcriptional regulator [Ignavibacteriota bacterium]